MTIRQARDALTAGDFATALEALADGDGEGRAPWPELRAQACYGGGEYEDAVAAWEQLHTLHRAAGERGPAARAAVMTAMFLLIDAGMLSTVRGWVRRAQRLIASRGMPCWSLPWMTGLESLCRGSLRRPKTRSMNLRITRFSPFRNGRRARGARRAGR